MPSDSAAFQQYNVDDIIVSRHIISVSMRDGSLLSGFSYKRDSFAARGRKTELRSPVPLLCLADELGNSREHHELILALIAQTGAPDTICSLDLRGRGLSKKANAAGSNSESDADDLISFCDAKGFHHCDIIVSGRGVFPILLAAPKRPGLVRRLVLNDGAPEFDAVGVARLGAIAKRSTVPKTWSDAVEQTKQLKQDQFPELTEDHWLEMVRCVWEDQQGTPVSSIANELVRLSNSTDYDSKQPALWREFKLFRSHLVLLIRGENSVLITDELSKKLSTAHDNLQQITVANQGHVPLLHTNDLPKKILAFLLFEESPTSHLD